METHLHVAVIGAGLAGLSCARYLQSIGCGVVVYDPARAAGVPVDASGQPVQHSLTICDMRHDEEGWQLVSKEQGQCGEHYDALALALPPQQAAVLLEPLLPLTALQVTAMTPSEQQCIWIPAVQVGLCGDWLSGGRVEDAWLSGRALAARMLNERAADQNSRLVARPKARPAPGTR
jgi:predicted NAD/FAD-dependent oxidoreductase